MYDQMFSQGSTVLPIHVCFPRQSLSLLGVILVRNGVYKVQKTFLNWNISVVVGVVICTCMLLKMDVLVTVYVEEG